MHLTPRIMKLTFKILIITFSLFYCSCKKDNINNETLFSSPVGTMWTYVSSLSGDTLVWALTGHSNINGEDVVELSITQNVTNRYLYKQMEGKIYRYAQYVPNNTIISYPSEPEYSDTLIIFSEPSLEFVLDEEIGFNWDRKILTRSSNGYSEDEIYMEIIGQEQIETSSGKYQCTLIQDEVDNTYYVSDQGLIQISTTVPVADSSITINLTLIDKK